MQARLPSYVRAVPAPKPPVRAYHGQTVMHIEMDPTERARITDSYNTDRHLNLGLERFAQYVPQLDKGVRDVPHYCFRLENDLLYFKENSGWLRLALPHTMIKEKLEEAHDTEAHQGTQRVLERLAQFYYWKNRYLGIHLPLSEVAGQLHQETQAIWKTQSGEFPPRAFPHHHHRSGNRPSIMPWVQ